MASLKLVAFNMEDLFHWLLSLMVIFHDNWIPWAQVMIGNYQYSIAMISQYR